MRVCLPLIVSLLFFAGCTPAVQQEPKPYKPTTYNTAQKVPPQPTYQVPPNQKSTATYPGSQKELPKEEEKAPTAIVDSSITSTVIEAPIKTEAIKDDASAISQDAVMEKPLNNDSTIIRIAVLVPQKTIKKYAITTVNSALSYFLYKNYYFDLNVFNSGDEKEESILKALAEIKNGNYHYIIAPVTTEGAKVLATHVQNKIVFIPTLHQSMVNITNGNIVFGGIDYDQQVALLATKTNERVGTFSDGTSLSHQLNGLIKKGDTPVFYEKTIESPKANFRQLFKGSTSLNKASLYLNTPLVTSSLIASQLRANDLKPFTLLSTQINYNPLLLTLTQYEDRSSMYIANSIQKAPAALEEVNTMFGHDIVYDWVNYSTSIGTDFLCQQFFNGAVDRVFNEKITNNQVVYETNLYQPERNEFKKVF